MTTSHETDWMNHPKLREIVDVATSLKVAERMTLLKGLIPGVARDLDPEDFQRFVAELRLKGERFYDARTHPGEGGAARHVLGERDLEAR